MSVVEVYIRELDQLMGPRQFLQRPSPLRVFPKAEFESPEIVRDFSIVSGPSASLSLSIIRPFLSHPFTFSPEYSPWTSEC